MNNNEDIEYQKILARRKVLEEHDQHCRDYYFGKLEEPKSIKAVLHELVDAILEKYDLIEKE